jgi:hypothetical protein
MVEARALTVADYHSDGWLTVSKAVKGKLVPSPIREHGSATRS